MSIYITETTIHSTCGPLMSHEATLRLMSTDGGGELFEFIKFFQDKGSLSTETLTSYLIYRKLKESNG